jgi:diaminopimelate decarboxylase
VTPGEVPGTDAARHRALADRFGTPLYVYHHSELVAALADLRAALHPAMEVLYSVKANPNVSVCAAFADQGTGAEVSSPVELDTAIRAGFRPRDVLYVGPAKTPQELWACLAAGVRAIVVESFAELAELQRIGARSGVRPPALVRVNPTTVEPGARMAMGGRARPFGIDEEQLLGYRTLVADHPDVDILGVHAYLGTRILAPDTIVAHTRGVLALAERVSAATGIVLRTVDVGGGLGVAYFPGETDPDMARLRAGLAPVVDRFRSRHPHTRLLFEAGRYLTARAGVYLVRVRDVKSSQGRRFVVTDGGTHHHLPAVGIGGLVRRNFPLRCFTDDPDRPLRRVTVTGPLCTPSDALAVDVELPAPVAGDVIGVLRSGAYGPTASPGRFLSRGYPAEVLVEPAGAVLVRTRDDTADLLRQQRLHRVRPATVPV